METPENTPSAIEILLVEDNEADEYLTLHMLKKAKIGNKVSVVRDGAEALDYLFRRGRHTDAPRPDLVLLDLNLPKLSGLDVLAAAKSNPDTRTIPVVVMTGSQAETDIVKSYALNASCFITKPVQLDAFASAVSSLADFWFSIVKFPPREA